MFNNSYFGVSVNKVFEILFWFEDPLRYQVIKMNTHCGRGRSVVSLGQPCQFERVFVLCVFKVQRTFDSSHMTRVVSVVTTHTYERHCHITSSLHHYFMTLAMTTFPQFMSVTTSPFTRVWASAPSIRIEEEYHNSFSPTSEF